MADGANGTRSPASPVADGARSARLIGRSRPRSRSRSPARSEASAPRRVGMVASSALRTVGTAVSELRVDVPTDAPAPHDRIPEPLPVDFGEPDPENEHVRADAPVTADPRMQQILARYALPALHTSSTQTRRIPSTASSSAPAVRTTPSSASSSNATAAATSVATAAQPFVDSDSSSEDRHMGG